MTRYLSKNAFTAAACAAGFAGFVAFSVAPTNAATLAVASVPDPTGSNGPNLIHQSGSFDVTDQASNGVTTDDTLVLIVGAIDRGAAPTISFTASGCPICVGETANTTPISFADTSSTMDVYRHIGFASVADEGNSGTAWSADDERLNNITPTRNFYLYTYDITLNSGLTAGSSIALNINDAAAGSFVLAYSCVSGTALGAQGCAAGDNVTTPIQDAGLVDPPAVPEPASLTLFGTALLGLFAAKSRRRGPAA